MMIALSHLYAERVYKYSYIPKKVYENQIFPITILEMNSEQIDKPSFNFDQRSSIQPLFNKPLLVKNGNDSFHTFYFKAENQSLQIPTLRIKDKNNKVHLEKFSIPISKLKTRDDFCGVLAADMKIKTSQSSTYDESNNLVTISIEAFEANVENMHLKNVIENGIEDIKRKNAKVNAEFYVVVPTTQKKLKFTYFNTIKQQYVFLETAIVIKDSSVSAQSQLNPKDDSFDKLKKYAFIAFSSFFFLLFLWKRDFFYLLLAVVSLITLFTFYKPKKKICIDEGTSLYILPTNTSRISTITDKKITTEILAQRAEFYKIEYNNKIIGWIKNENICKN
jgi:hypothetical protein